VVVLLEVGSIGKAHGLRGEVQVRLTTDLASRLDPGAVLSTDRGDLTVVSSRPHQGVWLVLFEGVADRSSAEALRGLVLRAEPLADAGGDFVHDLVGCRVVEVDGTDRGEVVAVQANPAADLLVLDDGRLVPMTFVGEVVPGERVVVDVPEGLFDL
jgi:16S rRNA processing protein RimM